MKSSLLLGMTTYLLVIIILSIWLLQIHDHRVKVEEEGTEEPEKLEADSSVDKTGN